MAEDPARDVGLALPKGLGHSHPTFPNPPFLFTVPKAGAVSSALCRCLSCILRDKGLPDRSGSKCQEPEDPLHRFSSCGRLGAYLHLELSAPWRVKEKHQMTSTKSQMDFTWRVGHPRTMNITEDYPPP